MANINTINIGNVVNVGLGDDLRTAFQKVNANFGALNNELTVTVSPAGAIGVSIFKEKVGADLKFKTLSSGTKMFIDDQGDTIVINSTAADAFTRIVTDSGEIRASNFTEFTLGGKHNTASPTRIKDIEVSVLGSTVSLSTRLPITDILTTYDFGPIAGNFTNAIQLAFANANIDFGTVIYPSAVTLDLGSIL